MIQEIFAEANYRARSYEETDEPYDSFIIYCSLKIYGISDGLTDDEEEEIYNGEVGKAVHIGNVTGLLILGTQAAKTGMDIYDICDSTDADAEFIYSALQEGDGPLAYDPYLDIFFIKSIEMNDGFNTDELKLRIIDCLPQFLLRCYHTYPDIIAAYPQPLPYEKSIHQRVKEGVAIEISRDMMRRFPNEPAPDDEGGIRLVLDEDQQNYILGRRIKGEGYPVSAIDKAEWELYHAAGFREHLNTKVLFRECRDDGL